MAPVKSAAQSGMWFVRGLSVSGVTHFLSGSFAPSAGASIPMGVLVLRFPVLWKVSFDCCFVRDNTESESRE